MFLQRLLVVSSALAAAGTALAFQAPQYLDDLPLDHPAIQYNQAPLQDPVTKLAQRVERGEVKLDLQSGPLGYLPSLLEQLGIRKDSQALAFAKGSFQAVKISPRNPRAIYFSDDAEVGYVPGGDELELTGLDPRQGVVFYTLASDAHNRPVFTRQTVCLRCHQGAATLGVPGIFIASVYPSSSGTPSSQGGIVTDHRTKFEDRWGGWYVTGTHGTQKHRGNAVAPDPAEPEALETEGTQNLTNLLIKFNAGPYLTPQSDIVALMTLEHQTQMINFMTRVSWEARMGGQDPKSQKNLNAAVDDLVAYMLFAEEAPLTAPVKGTSTFTQTFPERGPKDRHGRSLRDFDLKTRVFKYPLSYMIYSAAFDGMPDRIREQVYQRVYNILTGKDRSEKFAGLTTKDRRAILEIVRDTKQGLPAYWGASSKL